MLVLPAAAAAAALAAHWPVLRTQALLFDDQQYVIQNPLVQNPSWTSVKRFLGEVLSPSTVQGYYQPLAMISLMLDWASGARPDDLRPFHQTNLALHALNTALVTLLLYSLFGEPWTAAAVGLLFGVHPLTVEPVAWAGERKTLLASFFSFLSLILYVRYTRRSSWTAYGACLIAYVLALMSKPTSTPLPLLMLLLDFWPVRGRESPVLMASSSGRVPLQAQKQRLPYLLLEKIPFFVIGGLSAVITVISQGRTAAVHLPDEYSRARIPLIVCYDVVFYLGKIIYPVNLTPHYPVPVPLALSSSPVLWGVIGTAILVATLLISLRWTRALLTGWFFFFVAILPTMGIVGFTNVIAADKYAYLPSVGLLMVLAWLLARIWQQTGHSPDLPWWPQGRLAPIRSLPLFRRAGILTVVLLLAAAETLATRHYLRFWRDTVSLYRHMHTLAPDSPIVEVDLGAALYGTGRTHEAMMHYNRAIELSPHYAPAYYNRGSAYADRGDYERALADFDMAVRFNSSDAEARNNRGNAYLMMGDYDRAIADYTAAIELRPDYAEAYNNRGFACGRKGEFDRAVRDFSRAIELKPDYAQAYNNRAVAYCSLQEYEKAWADVRACRRLGGTPSPRLVRTLIEATGRSE